MTIKQSYNRTYEQSPSFQWLNKEISSNDQINVSWETYNAVTNQFLPFNSTRIINNGEEDIYFYPNQNESDVKYIPKGTIITIDARTIPALRTFAIKRAAATTITAGKIIVSCSREGQTTDSIVQRLHRRLFGGE